VTAKRTLVLGIGMAFVGFVAGHFLATHYRLPGMSPSDTWHAMPVASKGATLVLAICFYSGIVLTLIGSFRMIRRRQVP
jgi:hypothetical protein